MPRKSRKKAAEFTVEEPVALATALEHVADRHGLKAASDLPVQLPPPEPQLERLPRQERVGEHVAAVLARRMQPVPGGFIPIQANSAAGIRVNKSLDRMVAAIQFDNDRPPTRAEKDILEAIGEPDNGRNFVYRPERRQWERPVPDGMPLGENLIDAMRVAEQLAQGRGDGITR